MLINRYLVIGKRKEHWKTSARLAVKSPSLKSHEIAIALRINIPNELFSKPQLQASIVIPEDSVSAPVIDAQVIDNLQEVVSKQLGVDLSISLLESKDD